MSNNANGNLLFYLAIHPLIQACRSLLRMAYMNDLTEGDSHDVLSADALIMVKDAPHCLFLNDKKYEAISVSGLTTPNSILRQYFQLTPVGYLLLFFANPLGIGPVMNDCSGTRCVDLERAVFL